MREDEAQLLLLLITLGLPPGVVEDVMMVPGNDVSVVIYQTQNYKEEEINVLVRGLGNRVYRKQTKIRTGRCLNCEAY